MEPGLGTCRVRTWASTRGSSCSTFPLTSRARRLRRPLTLPGSSLSLFPAETEKPLKTMEPSQNRSQQAHLLQHQSTTTTTAHFHRDGAVPGHTRTQRMSLPTKGNLGSKSPSQLRSLLQAGSVLSYEESICTMESSPLWCKVPGMGGRGLSGTAHPGLRAQLPFQVPHPPFPSPFHQQLHVTKSPFSLRFMALHSWKMPRSLEKRCDLCALAVPTWWECTGSQDPALGVGDPAVTWFIWLSSLLTLLEGLRLTHFLLRSFLLPCQLLEFKPSLCSSSAFRV